MKLLREFLRLPAAGRVFLSGRREPVRRVITVPAPLAATGNVVELRRPEARRTPLHAANESSRRAVNQ